MLKKRDKIKHFDDLAVSFEQITLFKRIDEGQKLTQIFKIELNITYPLI